MRIPYVIDNQTHKLRDVLNAPLAVARREQYAKRFGGDTFRAVTHTT